jgi:3-phosphoshikimate 1-carboxyvinyltransferase
MVLTVRRSPGFEGEVRVPGDKSITHRALILGALARGETRIRGASDAQDCRSTRRCIEALGVAVDDRPDGSLAVAGAGPDGLREPGDVLDCGNSGTTMRMLLGVLAGRPFHAVLTGDGSLRSRPMARVAEPLRRMGATVDGRGGGGRAPLAIRGGRLRGLEWRPEVASAQVKSAILLAGLQADGVTAVVEPAPSRDHTERMLSGFGATLERDGPAVSIRGGQRLRAADVDVPGDLSSAAFFLAAAAIVPGARVVVRDVGVNPTRTGFLDVLAEMGVSVRRTRERVVCGEPVADLSAGFAGNLQAPSAVGGDRLPRLIDEVPVLAVLAALARGTTTIRDAVELRHKESDRLAAMARGLAALGADVEERPDGLVVHGGRRLRGARVDAAGDHRIAMALAVAGLAAEGETAVEGAESVAISVPGFAAEVGRWS